MRRTVIHLARLKMGGKLTGSTLRLQQPFGKTFGLSIIVFVLILIASEALVRTDHVQALLASPSLGTRHYEFGPKFFQLKSIFKSEGAIDCIFLGNSMVNYAINPDVFAIAYKEMTGQDIRCFNFAIDAIPASVVGSLAPILVDEFQPKVLVYGMSARDYSVPREDEETKVILDSEWVQYRLGNFNIEGWLYQHSYFYRYRDYFPRLFRFNLRDILRSTTIYKVTENGYLQLTGEGMEVDTPPDPGNDWLKRGYDLLYDYTIRADNLEGLNKIVNLNGPDLQVNIVEMPVPDNFFYFFKNGEEDYQLFVDQASNQAQAGGVRFLKSSNLELIPDDGWADYMHVNPKGARIFSDWLGHELGEVKMQDELVEHNP